MKAKPPRATEAQCQRTIIDAATRAGWLVHAVLPAQTGQGAWLTRQQGQPGFPDLILIHPRHCCIWAIELKRHPNKPDPAQLEWLAAFGHRIDRAEVVWVPEGLAAFLAELANPERYAA